MAKPAEVIHKPLADFCSAEEPLAPLIQSGAAARHLLSFVFVALVSSGYQWSCTVAIV